VKVLSARDYERLQRKHLHPCERLALRVDHEPSPLQLDDTKDRFGAVGAKDNSGQQRLVPE